MHATYLADIRRSYRNYRKLAEAAIAQISDQQMQVPLDADDNSIAVIMQHVAGNLRSRFSGFLTSDGEKPDRNRDAEFEARPAFDRAATIAEWNEAWAIVLGELEALTPDDLERTIYIRREPFLVIEALNRSVTHTAYHVGQIVFLAKHLAGASWTSLSIPKGRSAEFGTGTFKQGIVPR
ncbi:MAG TPA: DUF1572 family protein [Vicinamibacterales bacterium]|nr:DUF1572 family protein [Vicinamibacterales bacterium]